MSFGKKIILLLILLVLLVAYSVYNFDYKTILSKNGDLSNPIKEKLISKNEDSLMNKLNSLKEKVLSSFDMNENKSNISSIPSSFDLVKEDGNIILNGMFKDKNELEKVMETLNINREGNITFNENCVLDENILIKLSSLMTPFKDFFINDSKLSFISGNVSLDGELKDSNYKNLLDSIISRVDLDLKTNIKEPSVSKTQEIIEAINENNTTIDKDTPVEEGTKETAIEKNTEVVVKSIDKNLDKIAKVSMLPNLSQKSKEIQSKINDILLNKKITFERRSTKITEDSRPVLKEIADILISNSNIKIEVAGHTDSRGSESLNKRISQDRASSVMNSLIELGINRNRLEAVGYGESSPIAKDDENGLSEINRRVEFNIIGE